MPNVCGLIAPEGILSDIRSMVPDALKGASNEDKIQVTRHKLRVHGRPLGAQPEAGDLFQRELGRGAQLHRDC